VEGLPSDPANGATERLATALVRLAPHAIATRAAADLIARSTGEPARDELRLVAVLHDMGKAVLAAASRDYLATLVDPAHTPEERLVDERRSLGLDHAAMGAIAAGRLGLPKSVATAIERHHAEDAGGPAAIVRLADMLATRAYGGAVSPGPLAAVARRLRIDDSELRRIAYDLPRGRDLHDGGAEPSPLTPMQEKVLTGLAAGHTYKQIAAELSVSESTVRTHLHNLYGKLDVSDRAQAVLLAAGRGWI
jgi:putative nucleotidyltransferase with HDIG domain